VSIRLFNHRFICGKAASGPLSPLSWIGAGLVAVVVFASSTIMGTSMTSARSPDLPVVRLSCPKEPVELCRAAMRAVAKLSDGQFIVRLVEQSDVMPERDGDLGVALTLDGQGDAWIEAHFAWQVGPNGSKGRGPSIGMDVVDTALAPEMYGRFVENLIREDQGLTKLLSCACP
jgi:hypothetical protein